MGTSDGSIPSASTLSDNPKIVTVEMHRVGEWDDAMKNKANGLATPEVVDVPLGIIRVRRVSKIGKKEQRVAGAVSSEPLKD